MGSGHLPFAFNVVLSLFIVIYPWRAHNYYYFCFFVIIIIIIIIIIIKLSDNSLLIEHCTIYWTSFTAASVNNLWQSSPVKMQFDECRGNSSRPIADMVPIIRLLT